MGEIGQGVAVAFEALALGIDEGIEILGQAGQLTRVAFAQSFLVATLDAGKIRRNFAQWRHAPAQHAQQQQDEQHAKSAQPCEQGASECGHLVLQRAGVLGDIDRQLELRAIIDSPGNALGEHEQFAIGRLDRPAEFVGAAFQLRAERQIEPECGG